MKICYKETRFKQESLQLIEKVNIIIDEYNAKGYDLTLRQVYYQLVARDVIPNNERSYKNLGTLISNGRMAGLIDWYAIVDRTRNLRSNSHWSSPGAIIKSAAHSYAVDKWQDQDCYMEVWVEKDALVGVVGQICQKLDIPYFSCRGYVSQSEMWAAARRLEKYSHKDIHIIHLGDHDPSGKDMSRDIVDRLNIFEVYPNFKRIALNMNQIEEYGPPPNPTKLTDSRATNYISEFGYECWELDALEPEVITSLIESKVNKHCDLELFQQAKENEKKAIKLLETVANNWEAVAENYS